MKRDFIFALAAFFFITMFAITVAYADEMSSKWITILKDETDVTGDGRNDIIKIKGIPYEAGMEFFKDLKLEINASNNKTFNFGLEEGTKPIIHYADLNHDGLKDIIVTINDEGDGGVANHFIYTAKDFVIKELSGLESLVINSQFRNDYKADITIQKTGESFTFELRDRASDYEKSGLYRNGKLNEPIELKIDSFSDLKPVLIKGHQYGLKASQAIYGASEGDRIAIVESNWLFKNGKWLLMKTKVLEQNPKR